MFVVNTGFDTPVDTPDSKEVEKAVLMQRILAYDALPEKHGIMFTEREFDLLDDVLLSEEYHQKRAKLYEHLV